MDSRPWDYQAEESSLRSAVDRFNHRRYQRELPSVQQQSQMQQSQEKSTESQIFGEEVRSEMNNHAASTIFKRDSLEKGLFLKQPNTANLAISANCNTF